jgi:hypothetical protein
MAGAGIISMAAAAWRVRGGGASVHDGGVEAEAAHSCHG